MLAAIAIGGALAVRANNKRSQQIADLQDPASLPEVVDSDLYDPLRRGPYFARSQLDNRALHFRKRWPQPYTRPLHFNGQSTILIRSPVGESTAMRMQHIYAESLPEGPPFFTRKTLRVNRQIQAAQMPSYQPGLTTVDLEPHEFNALPMPFNYPGHAVA